MLLLFELVILWSRKDTLLLNLLPNLIFKFGLFLMLLFFPGKQLCSFLNDVTQQIVIWFRIVAWWLQNLRQNCWFKQVFNFWSEVGFCPWITTSPILFSFKLWISCLFFYLVTSHWKFGSSTQNVTCRNSASLVNGLQARQKLRSLLEISLILKHV